MIKRTTVLVIWLFLTCLLPVNGAAEDLGIADAKGLTRFTRSVTGAQEVIIQVSNPSAVEELTLESKIGFGEPLPGRYRESGFIVSSVPPGQYRIQITPPSVEVISVDVILNPGK